MSDEGRRSSRTKPQTNWCLMKTLGCVAPVPVASRQSPEILMCLSTFNRFVLMDRRQSRVFHDLQREAE
jgi:hypothetical protein